MPQANETRAPTWRHGTERHVAGQPWGSAAASVADGASYSTQHGAIGSPSYLPQVVFESDASTLVPGDTNGVKDVFVLSYRLLGGVSRISIRSDGVQGNGASFGPVISDGAFVVAFTSYATNLVPGDENNTADVFVWWAGSLHLMSRATGESCAFGNGPRSEPAISRDGRYVGFTSSASNLVPVWFGGTAAPPACSPVRNNSVALVLL